MINPILVKKDGETIRLHRVAFQSPQYNEEFLQNLIDKNPYILPIEDIGKQGSDPSTSLRINLHFRF